MKSEHLASLAAAVWSLSAAPLFAAVVVVGNVTYEDFQPALSSLPAPSNGTGATSPLDPTWNYDNDPYSTSHIRSPSGTDYLQTAGATFTLVSGVLHGSSQPLSALADGLLQRNNNDVARSTFGDGGAYRFRVDLHSLVQITEVNTYSWPTDTRTIQFYNLYGSASASAPSGVGDLAANGWTLIATVDSNVLDAEPSGTGSRSENSKHGVSIDVGGPPINTCWWMFRLPLPRASFWASWMSTSCRNLPSCCCWAWAASCSASCAASPAQTDGREPPPLALRA